MEMYLNKATDSFLYSEELDIIDQLIHDDLIFSKEFFHYTSNSISLYTSEPKHSPEFIRILHCKGEYSNHEDEQLICSFHYPIIESVISELMKCDDNLCRIAPPCRINGMFTAMGAFKYGDMFVFVIAKNKANTLEDLGILCAGICAALHTIAQLFKVENEIPKMSLADILLPEDDNAIAKIIKRWFNAKPAVVQKWEQRIAADEAEQKRQENENDDES